MIFTHNKTGLTALYITPYDSSWKNQDDPNCYRIRCPEDLPDMTFDYLDIGIHPAISGRGKTPFYHFLCAFFMDEATLEKNPLKKRKLVKEGKKAQKDFWFLLCPSGFPDKKIPTDQAPKPYRNWSD